MVKVGLVGCGYWGSKYLRAFNETPGGQVAAIYDIDPAKLKQAQVVCPSALATSDYSEFLASGIEAVVIATPASTHFPLAREALFHSKHVLVEKPFATTTADALHLVHLAEGEKLSLMVGSTFLYSPPVEFLKETILNGQLGSILYINSSRLNFGLLRPDVDVLWDLAPHDIAIILHLLGQTPLAVAARGVGCVNGGLSEIAHADLAFPDGLFAHIHVSWLEPAKIRRLTVVGSERMVVYDDTAAGEAIRIYDRQVKLSPRNGAGNHHHQVSYSYGDVRIPHLAEAEPLKEECRHFLQCIETGDKPLSDGWHGLQVISILETLGKSLEDGGVMEPMITPCHQLDEQSESVTTVITPGD
jgi:predicted dehydrogenase